MKIEINSQFHQLRPLIDQLPEIFNTQGEIIYDERNVIKRFQIDNITLIVKRYRRPNIIQRIVYTFFRSSKAKRSFFNARRLLEAGVQTPVNIAYIEQYQLGLLEYCYYISDVDDAPPIRERLIEPDIFDRTMATDFACFAAELHQKGILHGDLNSTNVLYHPQPDGHFLFSVIDINRMRFYDDFPPIQECMENLTRFTGRMDLFKFVAEQYCKHLQLPSEMVQQLIATKEKHDANWIKRKKRGRLLKRLTGKN